MCGNKTFLLNVTHSSYLVPIVLFYFLCKSGIRLELNSVRSLMITVGTSTMQLSVSQKVKSPHRTSTECLPSPKRLITVLIWLANTSSIWFKTHIVFINLFLIFQRQYLSTHAQGICLGWMHFLTPFSSITIPALNSRTPWLLVS